MFPISDFSEVAQLCYSGYTLLPPKSTPEDCRSRGETYAQDLRVTLQLLVFEVENPEAPPGEQRRSIRNIKEQEVFLCEVPCKTPENTFVIGGVDRVILRQICESPGVRFLPGQQGKLRAQIAPHRGARLSFELDRKGLLWTRINRSKKRFYATTFLRALGLSTEEIIARLCVSETFLLEPGNRVSLRLNRATLLGQRLRRDVVVDGELIARKHSKVFRSTLRKLEEKKVDRLPFDEVDLLFRALACDVIDQNSGEILREATEFLQPGDLRRFQAAGVQQISLVLTDGLLGSSVLVNTLRADRIQSQEDAFLAIYRVLRPGDAPTLETAQYLFENLFFSESRYHLSRAGRIRINWKLHTHDADPPQGMTLAREDIIATVRELLDRDLRWRPPDDIDHIHEAVVRDLGGLLGDVFFLGLTRIERAAKERMSLSQELDMLMPHDLINGRPLQRVLHEFFGWSRVSERVDFLNPVAEICQRRRISAAEPDRTNPRRSSYRIRAQHESYLGMLCPIESRFGLTLALACSVNPFGFLSSPLSSTPQDPEAPRPIHPWEILGPAASLIPFVSHDALETAAQGIENLRRAIPSMHPEAPDVATGLEAEIAHASGLSVLAPRDGHVAQANAREIVLEGGGETLRIPLRSFEWAPRGVVIRQRPVVRAGDLVACGDLLATGPGVASGEVACGHNLRVAFVSGVTIGASLVLSEQALRRGQFSSIHLWEFRCYVATTGLGKESFQRDIPGLEEDEVAHLDEQGLAQIGSRVRPGDILAGRGYLVSAFPGDDEEPAVADDRSLRLPPGCEGVVIGAWIEKKREVVLPKKAHARARILVAGLRPIEAGDLLGSRHGDRGAVARVAPVEDMPILPDGTPVDLLMNPAYILESCAAGLLMEALAGAPGLPGIAPPFGALTEQQLRARLGGDGRVFLRDGTTGEPLDEPVTVGNLYMMKLSPLVDSAFEARSTGPLDPLSELPIKGGGVPAGQLIDEDTTTALMAHGASYTLREFLVHKGDSPSGRDSITRMLREHEAPEDHVTQGLDALIRELRSAGLDVQALDVEPPPVASTIAQEAPKKQARKKRRSLPSSAAPRTWKGCREERTTKKMFWLSGLTGWSVYPCNNRPPRSPYTQLFRLSQVRVLPPPPLRGCSSVVEHRAINPTVTSSRRPHSGGCFILSPAGSARFRAGAGRIKAGFQRSNLAEPWGACCC